MNVIFMGTSSAPGSIERDNTYLLLQNGGSGWLVDVGGNPLGKLKQAAVSLHSIQGVIFTHFHVDHIYGLPSLLWGMWIAGRKEALTVCCPAPNEGQLRDILQSYRTADWPIGFEVNIRPFDWEAGSVLVDSPDWRISTIPGLHGVPAVGLLAEADGRVLVYSSDTRPNERIGALPHIDVLIHEATRARGEMRTHTSLETLLQVYPLERVGHVYAVHLSDGEPYGDVLAECENAVRNKVTLAGDMLKVSV